MTDAEHERLIGPGLASLDTRNAPGVDGQYAAQLQPMIRQGLRRYLLHHVETGSFLRACLENDWCAAMLHANPSLSNSMLKVLALCLDTFPSEAWGSREKVSAWIEAGKEADEPTEPRQ